MPSIVEIKVPDIREVKDVPVIEVLVAPGDTLHHERRSSPLRPANKRPTVVQVYVTAKVSKVIKEAGIKVE